MKSIMTDRNSFNDIPIRKNSVSSAKNKNKEATIRRRLRGGTACCVPFCDNNSGRKPNLFFHEFPKDAKLREIWLNRIKSVGEINFPESWKLGPNSKVCADHFGYQGGMKCDRDKYPRFFKWKIFESDFVEEEITLNVDFTSNTNNDSATKNQNDANVSDLNKLISLETVPKKKQKIIHKLTLTVKQTQEPKAITIVNNSFNENITGQNTNSSIKRAIEEEPRVITIINKTINEFPMNVPY